MKSKQKTKRLVTICVPLSYAGKKLNTALWQIALSENNLEKLEMICMYRGMGRSKVLHIELAKFEKSLLAFIRKNFSKEVKKHKFTKNKKGGVKNG